MVTGAGILILIEIPAATTVVRIDSSDFDGLCVI